jgi:hypothetical protein
MDEDPAEVTPPTLLILTPAFVVSGGTAALVMAAGCGGRERRERVKGRVVGDTAAPSPCRLLPRRPGLTLLRLALLSPLRPLTVLGVAGGVAWVRRTGGTETKRSVGCT